MKVHVNRHLDTTLQQNPTPSSHLNLSMAASSRISRHTTPRAIALVALRLQRPQGRPPNQTTPWTRDDGRWRSDPNFALWANVGSLIFGGPNTGRLLFQVPWVWEEDVFMRREGAKCVEKFPFRRVFEGTRLKRRPINA